MEILPDGAADQALWWERHIIEVIAGVPPDAPAGTGPRPGYDPQARTLRQRELAKAGELAEAGRPVPLSTLQRLRPAYEKRGAWGLVDHRAAPRPGARTDKRVIEAIAKAVSEETDESTGTVDRLRRRVEKILEGDGADPAAVMPARATFYRLAARADSGKHTFGSARSRRSQAKTPEGPYGTVTAARPGEWTQIDSTPLDVRVVLDNGMTDRAELTWIIDIATRTIPAAVLRTSAKAVDAALLLARSMTPEPMRPGWPDALRMSRSVMPHRRLADIDRRLADAAARPVIVPETIACDHGSVYMSQAFRGACRAMGISLQPSHEGSPWEKGTVETSFSAVGTLFAQYVAGYTGSSVEHRGKDPDGDAAWSMAELQDLLDEWIVTTWNNRPHAGLSHPLMPGRELTPNEMYAALVETAGYVPVPLAASDYVELLPVTWRKVNAYGREDRQPHLRLQGAHPLPAPALRGQREERELGSPLRPSRHYARVGSRPPRRRRMDPGAVDAPADGPGALRRAGVGTRPEDARPPRRGPCHRGRDRPGRRGPARQGGAGAGERPGRTAGPEGGRPGQGGICRRTVGAGRRNPAARRASGLG
jgi:hypothetical protein